MTERINGLLSVKPGNEPEQGETRTFVIEQRPARNGKKAWIKIKNANPDYGGAPYRILSSEPTGFVDAHGNHSFNVEIEPTQNGGDAKRTSATVTPTESDTSQDVQHSVSNAALKVQAPSAATDGIMETRKHLMRVANLYNLCIKCVQGGINLPDNAATGEQYQSTLASVWIYMSSRRTTDGVNWWDYTDKMPDKPLQPKEEKELPF